VQSKILKILIFVFRYGSNKWRDSNKPSQILAEICKNRNLTCELPKTGETSLKINNLEFDLDRYGKKLVLSLKIRYFATLKPSILVPPSQQPFLERPGITT
jgi:hypothetical protein